MNGLAALFQAIIRTADIAAVFIVLPAPFLIWREKQTFVGNRVRVVATVVFALLLFKNLGNMLEWLEITNALDVYEDYTGLFVPVSFFFALFVFSQERSLKEVKRIRNYLSNIINSMPSVLVGVDVEGRVTQWNAGAQELTGLSSETAQGRLVDEVYPRPGRALGQGPPGDQDASGARRNQDTPARAKTAPASTTSPSIPWWPTGSKGPSSGSTT